ncbi:hypothetical protein AS156_38520 [Bradyrhizobium macuxiense]|uniref:Uncharacterized protein n=1 Tax=Bradyrhizobium macuxiense TaxID=1755647 RepID=A0A109JYS1_9BRAD|nr:hypothetical protein AS156_38520 [Bradyrhizobium macuxiense]
MGYRRLPRSEFEVEFLQAAKIRDRQAALQQIITRPIRQSCNPMTLFRICARGAAFRTIAFMQE